MSGAAQPTLDEVIDSRPLSGLQIAVFVVCGLVIFVDGYDIQTMGLAASSVAEEWNVSPASFGWVLSAALIGMAFSGFASPLGDRFGRAPTLAAALTLIGVSSIATAYSDSYWQMFAARFFTGLGFGVCQGNASALASDFAPARRRAMLMTMAGCNIGLGALTASLLAPYILDTIGWRGVFWIGGIAPLILAAVILLFMPESVRLLAATRPGDARIGRIMAQIAPGAAYTLPPAPPKPPWWSTVTSFVALLRPPYFQRTWRLWLVYALATFLLYLLMSWLPTLLEGAGWDRGDAVRGIAALQLGGVFGGLILAVLVDRDNEVLALILAFAAIAVGTVLFAIVPSSGLGWSLLLALSGAGLSGSVFVILAVAAKFYPPAIRAAGFGWAAAVARAGAVIGPLAGGAMLGSGLDPRYIVALLAGPALVCLLGSLMFRPVLNEVRPAPRHSAAAL